LNLFSRHVTISVRTSGSRSPKTSCCKDVRRHPKITRIKWMKRGLEARKEDINLQLRLRFGRCCASLFVEGNIPIGIALTKEDDLDSQVVPV
jgi:hypothetical protein